MWYTIDSDNRSTTLDICDEEVHKQEEMLAEDEEEEQREDYDSELEEQFGPYMCSNIRGPL